MHRHLQLHAALGQLGQRLAFCRFDLPDHQVGRAGQFGFNALPPHRRAAGKAVGRHTPGAASGAHQALVVGLADVDPLQDLLGVVLVPQRGLVHVPQVLGKFEVALLVVGWHIEGKRQQADHHAFVGLGRVAGNDDVVVRIDVAVHVGELELGFVDGGFECHNGLL